MEKIYLKRIKNFLALETEKFGIDFVVEEGRHSETSVLLILKYDITMALKAKSFHHERDCLYNIANYFEKFNSAAVITKIASDKWEHIFNIKVSMEFPKCP